MKRFFRAIASAAPAVMTALVVAFSAAGCTEVDESLGTNFIPNHQQMKLRVNTFRGIDTYIDVNDTIPASHLGKIFMGNYEDEVFGQVHAASMTDFFPYGPWNDGNYFGYKPRFDSIYLVDFYAEEKFGNSVEQTFYIYEMTDSLQRDSVYRINTPLKDFVPEKHLFSFTVDTEAPAGSVMDIKLEPTEEGKAFVQRLMDIDSASYANPWPEFRKKFNGLYFAPAPDSPQDAALYGVPISATSQLAPGLFVYFTNFEKNDPTKVDTTGVAPFLFTSSGWKDKYGISASVNLNVIDMEFDYPAQIADNIGKEVAMETAYIQSMGGVATKLKFSDELLTQIANLKKQDGIEYSDIVIDQARICFPIEHDSAEQLDQAPTRLGMYYTYSQPYLESSYFYYSTYLSGPKPIPDYSYHLENQPSSYGGPVAITYNGYVSRSQQPAYYQMIITNYLTHLVLDPENTPKEIWLGPEVNSRLSYYSQVSMQGSARPENPITLVLTYTLIR